MKKKEENKEEKKEKKKEEEAEEDKYWLALYLFSLYEPFLGEF